MSQKAGFKLDRYRDWDSEIESAIQFFIDFFGNSPNVLLANRVTFARLEIAFGMSQIENGTYEGHPQIGALDWGIADTRLAYDETLEDKEFVLERIGPTDSGGKPLEAPQPKVKAGSRS